MFTRGALLWWRGLCREPARPSRFFASTSKQFLIQHAIGITLIYFFSFSLDAL